MTSEWPLWEVFIRSQHGLAHKHAGSLHAPDAEMAVRNARDVYTRRSEGVSIWAVRSAVVPVAEPTTASGARVEGASPEALAEDRGAVEVPPTAWISEETHTRRWPPREASPT